jgi:hypothetical protein
MVKTRRNPDLLPVGDLPPHLREVCDILARGLLRLRSRTAEDFDCDATDRGESSLHFTAHQSVHAVPLERTSA